MSQNLSRSKDRADLETFSRGERLAPTAMTAMSTTRAAPAASAKSSLFTAERATTERLVIAAVNGSLLNTARVEAVGLENHPAHVLCVAHILCSWWAWAVRTTLIGDCIADRSNDSTDHFSAAVSLIMVRLSNTS
jgi:hypothetical protein